MKKQKKLSFLASKVSMLNKLNDKILGGERESSKTETTSGEIQCFSNGIAVC